MKRKRPQRVWFSSHWEPDGTPEHIVKCVVRYDPNSKHGVVVHALLKAIGLLIWTARERGEA